MNVVVLTVDQRGSRHRRRPGARRARRCWRRADPARPSSAPSVTSSRACSTTRPPCPGVVERLLREDAWNIGIGDRRRSSSPCPTTRAPAAAPAYLAAREAVTAAKSSPWRLRAVGDDRRGVRALETALWLWAACWRAVPRAGLGGRRPGRPRASPTTRPAQRLGISQSAVSQRAAAAGIAEGRRARELVAHLTPPALAAAGGDR